LSANGSNDGAGGTITITNQGAASGAEADINVGDSGNVFHIFATSGDRGGDGGTITLSTGRNMTIVVFGGCCPDRHCFNAGNLAGSGKGATYDLTAGTAMLGNLLIGVNDGNPNTNGSLDANAGLNGDGGTISLKSNSAEAFVINGSGITNGIQRDFNPPQP